MSLAEKETRTINEAYEQALGFVAHQEQQLERFKSGPPIVIHNEPLSDEICLRKTLSNANVCSNLELSIETARDNNEALQHILLISNSQKIGSTFARLIARGLGVRCLGIAAFDIKSEGEMATLLTNLQQRDVLFIENLERLDVKLEEMLRMSMKEFRFSLRLGTKDVYIDLERFTLVASSVADNIVSRQLSEQFKIRIDQNS
jgi:Holliday junction DNA helicase RuvB